MQYFRSTIETLKYIQLTFEVVIYHNSKKVVNKENAFFSRVIVVFEPTVTQDWRNKRYQNIHIIIDNGWVPQNSLDMSTTLIGGKSQILWCRVSICFVFLDHSTQNGYWQCVCVCVTPPHTFLCLTSLQLLLS